MTTPKKTDIPGYRADEERDGKSPATPAVHSEPAEPDPDPQGGSGTVDFAGDHPDGGEGADASNHGSA